MAFAAAIAVKSMAMTAEGVQPLADGPEFDGDRIVSTWDSMSEEGTIVSECSRRASTSVSPSATDTSEVLSAQLSSSTKPGSDGTPDVSDAESPEQGSQAGAG